MPIFRLVLLLLPLATASQWAGAAPPDGGVTNAEPARLPAALRIERPPIHDKFLSEAVWFERNKDILKPISFVVLDEMVREFKAKPGLKSLLLEGHADSSEPNGLNLSRRRAASVMVYLIEHGIERERLVVMGVGSGCPRASNDTSDNRAANSRVEFIILEQAGRRSRQGAGPQ